MPINLPGSGPRGGGIRESVPCFRLWRATLLFVPLGDVWDRQAADSRAKEAPALAHKRPEGHTHSKRKPLVLFWLISLSQT